MSPAMNYTIYCASPATAGPGSFSDSVKTSPSCFVRQSDTALIYSTEHHPGLTYRTLPGHTTRLRATAPAFAPGSHMPEMIYETDETETNTSDSEAETEISSATSTSDTSSSFECSSLPHASRGRLHYCQRLYPSFKAAQARKGDESLCAPGAPRIPFPPLPWRDTILSFRKDGSAFISQLDYPLSVGESPIGTRPTVDFDPFCEDDEEEAHYHLPQDLFSLESEMSSAEFAAMVRGWTQRRLEACMRTEVPVAAGTK